MDSKERHEMMSNELADWIGQIPDFLKQYRNQLLGLVLVIVGLVSWPILNRWRQEADFVTETEVSQALESLDVGKFLALQAAAQTSPQDNSAAGESLLVTADKLAEQAKKSPNDNLAAITLIKRGQALRTDLLYRKDAVTDDAAAAQIKQAQEAYQQAFDKAKLPTVKAMAQFGLGICSEELGQLDQAKEIYQKIADDATYAGTPLPAAAKDRIEKLADNNAKYTFVEAPKPAPVAMPIAAPAGAKAVAQPAPTQPVAPQPEQK
jgi:tetratricopeptide (TPR) repeat protein